MVKIAVLGAGINGLACAVQIKEKYKNLQVKLISCDFSPDTTGDGSGGLFLPYLIKNTPDKVLSKWIDDTRAFLHELWRTGAVSICLLPLLYLYSKKEHSRRPDWADVVYGYKELNKEQMECYSRRYSSKYTAGSTFVTFTLPPSQLLDYLFKRFIEANGEVLRAKPSSLQDPVLQEFDIIINCTGLGARFLVPDKEVTPLRGQIVKVKAPWLSEVVLMDSEYYILPNVETCVLGGTSQNSFDTKVDPKDTDVILNGCYKAIPSLKSAEIVTQWVGLRPSRDSVRLEPEVTAKGKLLIHNYGHGGSGFTLFWGCSNQVLQILDTYMNKFNTSQRNSKL